MTVSTLVYRGVSYAPEHPSLSVHPQPVEHIYRGVHFADSLAHEPAQVSGSVTLHYRGSVYHQRRQAAVARLQKR